jgi:Lrp/AsnC family transcriptional regulator for asnA, asnC and gidA
MTRLLEEKTIQIIGRIDPDKVGFHAYARIFISVKPAKYIKEVAKNLVGLPEVSFLALISGKYDLELNVQCRDNNHLLELMEKIQLIEGVYETETNMYLKVLKIAQPHLGLVRDLWVK